MGQPEPGQKYQSKKSGISYFQAPTAQMLVSDFRTYLIEILNSSVSQMLLFYIISLIYISGLASPYLSQRILCQVGLG